MDAPLRIDEISAALDIVAQGFFDHRVITLDTWNAILPTLVQSYSVLGGHSRRLVHRMFTAAYRDDHPEKLPKSVLELQQAFRVRCDIESGRGPGQRRDQRKRRTAHHPELPFSDLPNGS